MRTTVTLEPEVETLVRNAMASRRQPFRKVVNEAILSALSEHSASPYVTPTYRIDVRLASPKMLALAAELEDAELLHKLELGK